MTRAVAERRYTVTAEYEDGERRTWTVRTDRGHAYAAFLAGRKASGRWPDNVCDPLAIRVEDVSATYQATLAGRPS